MATVEDRAEEIRLERRQAVEAGDVFGEVDAQGRVKVYRHETVREYPSGRKEKRVSYLATTHWGSDLVSINARGNPSWSFGGTCEDATAEEIAYAMFAIWRDVYEYLSGKSV